MLGQFSNTCRVSVPCKARTCPPSRRSGLRTEAHGWGEAVTLLPRGHAKRGIFLKAVCRVGSWDYNKQRSGGGGLQVLTGPRGGGQPQPGPPDAPNQRGLGPEAPGPGSVLGASGHRCTVTRAQEDKTPPGHTDLYPALARASQSTERPGRAQPCTRRPGCSELGTGVLPPAVWGRRAVLHSAGELSMALSAPGIPCHPPGTWRDATSQRQGLTSSRPVSGE